MKFGGFLHLNIRCSPEDMPTIEKFYGDVLGLKTGYRPNFKFGGIWLYDGDDPIIHVSARFPQGSFVKDRHNGSVDHIAFSATDYDELVARFDQHGVRYRVTQVPGRPLRQLFVFDPDGIQIEINIRS